KETPDLTIERQKYKMDLIPPVLVVARYFGAEQADIEALEVVRDAAARDLDEFIEEHSGDEGLLEEARNDKGLVTRGGVKDRLSAVENEPDSDEERVALSRCLELIEAEAIASRAVNDAQAALDAKVLARYGKLTEAEIKNLVVDDKWFVSVRNALHAEVERLTQVLAGRVKELEERYAATL